MSNLDLSMFVLAILLLSFAGSRLSSLAKSDPRPVSRWICKGSLSAVAIIIGYWSFGFFWGEYPIKSHSTVAASNALVLAIGALIDYVIIRRRYGLDSRKGVR